MDCPFCKIISGEIPVKKIYEDDTVLAILDIYPANPGHVLLMTKEHHKSFSEVLEPDAALVGVISKKISENLIRGLKPDGLTQFIADGEKAGQLAPHFLMHIIPRFKDDNLLFDLKKQDLEINSVFEKIKSVLQRIFPEMNYDKVEQAKETGKTEKTENVEKPKEQGIPVPEDIEIDLPDIEVHDENEEIQPPSKPYSDEHTKIDDVTNLFEK